MKFWHIMLERSPSHWCFFPMTPKRITEGSMFRDSREGTFSWLLFPLYYSALASRLYDPSIQLLNRYWTGILLPWSGKSFVQLCHTDCQLTCRLFRTCQCAGCCRFPAAFAAPWSDLHLGCLERGDACSPGRHWRGFCTPACHLQWGSLRGGAQCTLSLLSRNIT